MNKLVDIRLHLDVPEERVEKIVGRPDDGSDEWHQQAWDVVEQAVRDEPPAFFDYITSEDVEVLD